MLNASYRLHRGSAPCHSGCGRAQRSPVKAQPRGGGRLRESASSWRLHHDVGATTHTTTSVSTCNEVRRRALGRAESANAVVVRRLWSLHGRWLAECRTRGWVVRHKRRRDHGVQLARSGRWNSRVGHPGHSPPSDGLGFDAAIDIGKQSASGAGTGVVRVAASTCLPCRGVLCTGKTRRKMPSTRRPTCRLLW